MKMQRMPGRAEEQPVPLTMAEMDDDDRALMDKFRAQVDGETSRYLHNEVDPRYRGAAIPSRAFRMLQTMTGSGPDDMDMSGGSAADGVHVQPRRPAHQLYTGAATPGRSFQMLQQMMMPENCANGSETDEINSNYPHDPGLWYYPYWPDPYWSYYYHPDSTYCDNSTDTSGDGESGNESSVDGQDYWVDPWYYYYYYGYPPPTPVPFSEPSDTSENEEQKETDCSKEDTDSKREETSNDEEEEVKSTNGLQAIRSVSDINTTYGNDDENKEISNTTEDEDDEGDDDDSSDSSELTDDSSDEESQTHLPHQLSIIYEASEASDGRSARAQSTSSDDSSATLAGDGDESDKEEPDQEETVTVRLPLRLKFSRTDDDTEITTVIVGDSEETKSQINELENNEDDDTDDVCVSVTVSIPSRCASRMSEDEYETAATDSDLDISVKSQPSDTNHGIEINIIDTSSEDDSSESDDDEKQDINNKKEVQENKATNSSQNVKEVAKDENEQHQEEVESVCDEDPDSGVNSTTDTESECFPELKKLTRYQRAATHSRLFKLLQDSCDVDDDDEEEEESVKPKEQNIKKSVRPMTLSLTDETDDSSGIGSPCSPINDKLAKELVHSALRKRKGRCYRDLPIDRLYAAAHKILQQQQEDTSSSEEMTDINEVIPSKTFRQLFVCPSPTNTTSVRCPRLESQSYKPFPNEPSLSSAPSRRPPVPASGGS